MDNIWFIYGNLVGGLEHVVVFLFNKGNFMIPTDELIFFQRGRYTTNQYV